MNVKEHNERVRFDSSLVEKQIPGNKYKLIHPKADGERDFMFEKF